jgi:hypothetical protein
MLQFLLPRAVLLVICVLLLLLDVIAQVPDSNGNLVFSNGVTSIAANAYVDNLNVTSVSIPSSVIIINASAFKGCIYLVSVQFTGSGPSQLVTIGQEAFSGTGLTTISIPTSVENILDKAFYQIQALENVNYATGSQLKTIGSFAFSQSGLQFLNIPVMLESIGAGAYENCPSLRTITFDSDVTSSAALIAIGDSSFAFAGIEGSIEFPDSLQSIGNNAFNGCTNLALVTFSSQSQLNTLGQYAFYKTGLTSFIVPSDVTMLQDRTFSNCTSLVSISFASGSKLQSIGNNVFIGSSLRGTVHVGPSVTSIGDSAFRGLDITSLEFDSGSILQSIGTSSFSSSKLIGTITFPSTLNTINVDSFKSCSSLTEVVFLCQASTLIIQQNAFASTGISSVMLPSSVTCSNCGVTVEQKGCTPTNQPTQMPTITKSPTLAPSQYPYKPKSAAQSSGVDEIVIACGFILFIAVATIVWYCYSVVFKSKVDGIANKDDNGSDDDAYRGSSNEDVEAPSMSPNENQSSDNELEMSTTVNPLRSPPPPPPPRLSTNVQSKNNLLDDYKNPMLDEAYRGISANHRYRANSGDDDALEHMENVAITTYSQEKIAFGVDDNDEPEDSPPDSEPDDSPPVSDNDDDAETVVALHSSSRSSSKKRESKESRKSSSSLSTSKDPKRRSSRKDKDDDERKKSANKDPERRSSRKDKDGDENKSTTRKSSSKSAKSSKTSKSN